ALLNHQLYTQGAYISLTWGDLTGARMYLDQMRPLNKPDRKTDLAHYHAMVSWLAMLEKDIDRSIEHAALSVQLNELGRHPFGKAISGFAFLQALYETGKRREAKIHLSRLLKHGRMVKSACLEFNALLLDAYFALNETSAQQTRNAAGMNRSIETLRRAMA